MKKFSAIFVSLFMFPMVPMAAGFDCAKASTNVEKMICADPQLSAYDEILSKNYKNLFGEAYGFDADGKANTKAAQMQWIVKRNTCDTRECLEESYKQRIDEICQIPVVMGVNNCQSLIFDQKVVSGTLAPVANVVVAAPKSENAAVEVSQDSVHVEGDNPIKDVDYKNGSASEVTDEANGTANEFDNKLAEDSRMAEEYLDKIENELNEKMKNLDNENSINEAADILNKFEEAIGSKVSALGGLVMLDQQANELNTQIGQMKEQGNPNDEQKIQMMRQKRDELRAQFHKASDSGNAIRDKYDLPKYREAISDAATNMMDNAKKEAEAKKVAVMRAKAFLNEEEYIIPLFECSVEGSFWCFSSSHKIYAVTGRVTISDESEELAAVYQEIGQGEAEDYYKDKSSAAAELFVGRNDAYSNAVTSNIVSEQKIWISGAGRMPHVFMSRERR